MTENEFVHYQSTIINYEDSVAIKEARECVGEIHELESNTTLRIRQDEQGRGHIVTSLCIKYKVSMYVSIMMVGLKVLDAAQG